MKSLALDLRVILSPLLCEFNRHEPHIITSSHNGLPETVCLICGKTLDGNDILK